MISPLAGVTLIIAWFTCMYVAISVLSRSSLSARLFLAANHNIGVLVGMLSLTSAWIQAPALFISSQQAFDRGLPGVFWFTLPNALALLVFSVLARRMRDVMVTGFTLPEFIHHRLGVKCHLVYIVSIFIIQAYAVILLFTAAFLMLNLLTGLTKPVLILLLAAAFLSFAALRGIKSSIAADLIKASMISAVVILIIPWVVSTSGGWQVIRDGFGGLSRNYISIVDRKLVWEFGVPISITLISAVVVDQQQWQRAFSIKASAVRASYVAGAIVFALVPLSFAVLGFAAAALSEQIEVPSSQLAGISTVKTLLPPLGTMIFTAMVLAALSAAGSGALCASSSVATVDIYKRYLRPDASDNETVRVARLTMGLILLVGIFISLIPNIQLLSLALLIGAFRASLLIPTLLSLFWPDLKGTAALGGILAGMFVGLPVFIYGSVVNSPTISSWGSIIPIVLSGSIAVVGSKVGSSEKYDYRMLSMLYNRELKESLE